MTRRTYQLANALNAMRQTLIEHEDDEESADNLIESGNHPYRCRCPKCKQFWKSLGPDPDTNEYGPFSREEIEGVPNRKGEGCGRKKKLG